MTASSAVGVATTVARSADTSELSARGGLWGDDTADARPRPSISVGVATVVGSGLPPEVVKRIVRQNVGRFRLCYEQGLVKDAALAGNVEVSFMIVKDGSVSSVKGKGDLPDEVIACVSRAFKELSFPAPEGKPVNVKYPISFSAPQLADSASAPGSSGSAR